MNAMVSFPSGAACWIVVVLAWFAPAGGMSAEQRGPVPGAGLSRAEGTSANWHKYADHPVLGGDLGTCFDVTLLQENGRYRMWFSWRPKESIALVESPDGIRWSEPHIVLAPDPATTWEGRINRPAVLRRDGVYHMWYTGQSPTQSWLGHATSPDGRTWTRRSARPVLAPEQPWEGVAVMCPHVLWDEKTKLYRMWYSGGQQYEPNAIGCATSSDGINWSKYSGNPIFAADRANPWERHKVTACQVIPAGDWYLMFYIGFRDENRARIGLARSRDGITGWQRHPANPIIFPTPGAWDADACYKPFALFDKTSDRWLLWYNGRKGSVEQIGLAIHPGHDLGFPTPLSSGSPRDKAPPHKD
jgi:sucrose-6-phosphate hydrolase SacC (GH32 family)